MAFFKDDNNIEEKYAPVELTPPEEDTENDINLNYMEAKGVEVTPEFFGPLWPYINDDDITDVDWNGSALFIKTCGNEKMRGSKEVEDQITPEFIDRFVARVSISVGKEFNKLNPVLEAETPTLRLSIVNNNVAVTGISICIRKTPPFARIEMENALKINYITPEMAAFTRNIIRARMNTMVCGGVGVGKTEFVKLIAQSIPKEDRVITIEDNLELHLKNIDPERDIIEFQVSPTFSYQDAIKTCLRQNLQWMMISEIRGTEAKDYITGLTTGVHGITTLHTDDARKIPERVVNMSGEIKMADRISADIYSFLDCAVLIARRANAEGKVERFIDQVVLFTYEGGRKDSKLIFNNRRMMSTILPREIEEKFLKANIDRPFYDAEIEELCLKHNIPYDTSIPPISEYPDDIEEKREVKASEDNAKPRSEAIENKAAEVEEADDWR